MDVLLRVHLDKAYVIDCQNYGDGDATYPLFFRREAYDPSFYYVFVNRGDFASVPAKHDGQGRKPQTCRVPQGVHHINVMMCTLGSQSAPLAAGERQG